jgi:cytochrome c oxidase subunit 3
MANVRAEELRMTEWDGGVLPYSVGHKKLGMWLFIVSDALTFSALLIGYSYLRVSTPNWPTPFHLWPSIAFSSLMTFCLLSSSLTMVLGVNAIQRNDRAGTIKWILLTIAGGVAFMGLHLKEWSNLFHEGITLVSNPWGVPQFGATFFGITGLHMFTCLREFFIWLAWHRGLREIRCNTWKFAVCTGTSSTWYGCSFSRWYLLSVKMHYLA